MIRKILFPGTLILLAVQAFSQTKHYTKLEIKSKEIFDVGAENTLTADTLIMRDKSMIRFSPETLGTLQAKVVFIGNNCVISAKGAEGKNFKPGGYQPDKPGFYKHGVTGTPGQDGGNLAINLNFVELGSLTIDSQGGAGGDGMNGKNGARGTKDIKQTKQIFGKNGKPATIVEIIPGVPGTDGTDATTGLNGGSGGDIELIYAAKDFIPVFNNAKGKNRITILNTAGKTGKNGVPGRGGINEDDGKLIELKTQNLRDGVIKLSNANSASASN